MRFFAISLLIVIFSTSAHASGRCDSFVLLKKQGADKELLDKNSFSKAFCQSSVRGDKANMPEICLQKPEQYYVSCAEENSLKNTDESEQTPAISVSLVRFKDDSSGKKKLVTKDLSGGRYKLVYLYDLPEPDKGKKHYYLLKDGKAEKKLFSAADSCGKADGKTDFSRARYAKKENIKLVDSNSDKTPDIKIDYKEVNCQTQKSTAKSRIFVAMDKGFARRN